MKKNYTYLFIALLIIYIILGFTLPSDPTVLAKHELTQTSARLLNLTIVVPISIIYLVALYGYIRFDDYSRAIRKTKEGPHYANISNGLCILALSLPLGALMNSLVAYFKFQYVDLYPIGLVGQTYINLALLLSGIIMAAKGAEGLYGTVSKNTRLKLTHTSIITIILFSSMYIWLVTSQSPEASSEYVFLIPEWLVVFTLAVPYLFAWTLGGKTTYLLYKYKQKVRGKIFKSSFDSLYKGFGLVIVISITVRLLITLSAQFNRLNLTPLLAFIYVLVFMYAVGYGLLARGARKLKRIEEA